MRLRCGEVGLAGLDGTALFGLAAYLSREGEIRGHEARSNSRRLVECIRRLVTVRGASGVGWLS